MKRETRFTSAEFKFDDGTPGEMTFEGYGARFGNTDAHDDVIAKGAFRQTLADARKSRRWPAMLLQHGGSLFGSGDDNMPVGLWTEMREDDKGLWVEGKLADTQRGRDAYALMKMQPRPAIDGLSVGFRAIEWSMRSSPDEPRRTLKRVDLLEVSLVTFPANPDARVAAVKAGDITTVREFEAFLRDVGGFSNAAARKIAADGYKATDPDPRDEDEDGADLQAIIRRNIDTLKRKG